MTVHRCEAGLISQLNKFNLGECNRAIKLGTNEAHLAVVGVVVFVTQSVRALVQGAQLYLRLGSLRAHSGPWPLARFVVMTRTVNEAKHLYNVLARQ